MFEVDDDVSLVIVGVDSIFDDGAADLDDSIDSGVRRCLDPICRVDGPMVASNVLTASLYPLLSVSQSGGKGLDKPEFRDLDLV